MVEQERQKGTARVLTGNFEFRDGNAAEVAKRALLEAGFDLDIEEIRENGYMGWVKESRFTERRYCRNV